jgi:hypothetical protein
MSLATDMSDGIGGLSFVAQAPPGIGRLIRIPFYLQAATAGFQTMAPGVAMAAPGTSTTCGIIWSAPTAAIGAGNTAILTTPQISWATLRIVGFECAVNYPQNNASATGVLTELCFSDFQIGGGANLFVHEDFAPASIYQSGLDSFSGLRDYPILKSPNTAQVSAQLISGATGLNAIPLNVNDCLNSLAWSCNLVCEILQDDNYGSHIPGPYARKGAMVRRGGSFV